MKRISLLFFVIITFIIGDLYGVATNPSSNLDYINNQVPGVVYISRRTETGKTSTGYTEWTIYVTFSAYGRVVEKLYYSYYRYASDRYTYNYRYLGFTKPSDWDSNRYKYVGNGFLDTVNGTLVAYFYQDAIDAGVDPVWCTLTPVVIDDVKVGFIDECNNKNYDMNGNSVLAEQLGLTPYKSGDATLGYFDSKGNWYGLGGASNPYNNTSYVPVYGQNGNLLGYMNTSNNFFYNQDRTEFLSVGNDNINGYVPLSDENGNFLGLVNKDGQWRDINGNSISAPTGFGAYIPSSDAQYYSPLFNGSGQVVGWGNGTDYIVTTPDNPDPAPDNPDPDPDNHDPDPDPPDPPDPPEPPTPPDPGAGGMVNQYNDITQNNDYSVTNNDNRSYNYNFNDTGSYTGEGMFSGLSLARVVPSRVSQGMSRVMNSVGTALGVDKVRSLIQVSNRLLGTFCIDNRELSELQIYNKQFIPHIRACIDFNDLARKEYVSMIRTILLFIVLYMFISSVYAVLIKF